VYRHADGATSVPELTARLSATLGTPDDDALTALALAELSRVHLVDAPSSVAEDAVTRRDVVRRLATVLAVPLVTSLVVPAAAAAQSKFDGGPPRGPHAGNPIGDKQEKDEKQEKEEKDKKDKRDKLEKGEK
jgi:hypothetical protein